MPRPLPEDAAGVLQRSTIDGNRLTLPEQLARTQYLSVDRVIAALGGRWDRKEKCHIFDGPIDDRITDAVQAGEYSCPKKDLSDFPTPMLLAQRIAEAITKECGSPLTVLEPSAGCGVIASALVDEGHSVVCVEIQQRHVEALRMQGFTTYHTSFLNWDVGICFDAVAMNPPFGSNGTQYDIDHIRYAWNLVKQGGVLISIASAGWVFRNNRKSVNFRGLIEKYGKFEEMASKMFQASGTNVATTLVTLRKPIDSGGKAK